MSIQRRAVLAGVAGLGFTGAGCLSRDRSESATITTETLSLATTTSTHDTGLLDELNAAFEERIGVTVETIGQGTGAALETARRGDADVVIVHARSLEDEFIRDGIGINRRDLMLNDFVLLGPPSDPAAVAGESIPAAFTRIAEGGETFVSRGDESGTHTREKALWDEAGIEPGGSWYLEAGQGMGEVLTQADRHPAYTLSDRGTYLSMADRLELTILIGGPLSGGPTLLANPYGIIAVNPAVHEHVAYDAAMAYIGFLTGPDGQARIEEFTVNGEQLFHGDGLSEDANFEQYVPENWPEEREP